jgi:TolB-like protein
MASIWSELKRRNVFRVAAAYAVAGWLLIEVASTTFPILRLPEWTVAFVTVLVIMGFPIALILAWAYELTPEGIKREKDVIRAQSVTHLTGRKLDFVIIGALVVALGYFIWDRQNLVESDGDSFVDKSIAVLPFVNIASDHEQDWVADGLTEEILNALTRTPDLRVASRMSSFQYKGKTEEVSKIGASLGVAHILAGSVRRGEDRLRVTAQLTRTSDGFQLWSETFDRKPDDIIAIQEDVAVEIANALKTAMDPVALREMVSAGTSSVAAYEAYLKGLARQARWVETGGLEYWNLALKEYDTAVALDPSFAIAYWRQSLYWRAQSHTTLITPERNELSREEKLSHYLAAIDGAINNENDKTRALKYRAHKAANTLRYKDAQALFEQYMQSYPYDVESLGHLIGTVSHMRDAKSVREYVGRITQISNVSPESLTLVLSSVFFAGLVDDAISLARSAVRHFPRNTAIAYQAQRAFLWAGHIDEARLMLKVLRNSEYPELQVKQAQLRQACAERDLPTAKKLLNELGAMELLNPSSRFIVSQIAGKPDEAHRRLMEAELDTYALASFLPYPYFDHTLFPELVTLLEKQGIDRRYIKSPPYACPDMG